MPRQHTKKLTIDFPAEAYFYLKMACVKQETTIKKFVTSSVIKSIEDSEDELLGKKARKTLKEIRSGKEKTLYTS